MIESQFSSADGSYSLRCPPPPAGDYGFTTVFVGSSPTLPGSYGWEWTILVPEPAAAAGSLAAALGLLAVARSRAGRTDRSD